MVGSLSRHTPTAPLSILREGHTGIADSTPGREPTTRQREMALAVRRRLTAAGHSSAFVLQSDARRIPLRGGSVDHVFLVSVLGEIQDRCEALVEICRVLRSGGRLSVSEQLPDPDFVTPQTLRRELRAAGFVEEITRGHLFYTSNWIAVG